MTATVGIFTTRAEAERAIEQLRSAGIPHDHINLLTPGASEKKIEPVPTTETEQPDMGGAIGGVIGGALGAASGMSLGAAAATMLVPGVGPVIAMGVLGAALLGAGGAVGGAVIGEALDKTMAEDLPAHELFVYEDALRRGRSVVIVLADEDKQADAAQMVLEQAGAESIAAARESWWVGLREAEEGDYRAQGKDFKLDELNYRRGFESALHLNTRGKSYDEATNYLMAFYPDVYREESFRRGYERGLAHYEGLKLR
jgi:hypothetical protein